MTDNQTRIGDSITNCVAYTFTPLCDARDKFKINDFIGQNNAYKFIMSLQTRNYLWDPRD